MLRFYMNYISFIHFFQGFFIFLFYCLIRKEAKEVWRNMCRCTTRGFYRVKKPPARYTLDTNRSSETSTASALPCQNPGQKAVNRQC